MKKHSFIAFLVFLFQFGSLFGQKKYFVPDDFATIQAALNAVQQFDTIIVRPGRYFENIKLNEDFVNGVKLLSETNATNTIIDAGKGGSCFALSGSGFGGNIIDTNFVIRGFTFTNSYSDSGISISDADVKLVDLVVENNVFNSNDWSYGGGLHFSNSNSIIDNCIIRNNKTVSTLWSYGAGCYSSASELTITNSQFINNISSSTEGWAFGGGIYFEYATKSKISKCEIRGNRVSSSIWNFGAGISCDGFGESEELLVEDTYIIGNEIGEGTSYGGTAINSDGAGININNCVISQNRSKLLAASVSTILITNFSTDTLSLHINCSSIANNGGSIALSSFSSDFNDVSIINSIIWNHTAFQLLVDNVVVKPILANCVMPSGNIGKGMVTQKPIFVDTILLVPTKDFSGLNKGSLSNNPPKDILGVPRPLNGLPDIGAYEVNGAKFYVKAQFYLDKNANGLYDNGEVYIDQGSIIIDNTLVEYNSEASGIFAYLSSGNHTIKYNSAAFDYFVLTSNNPSLSILLDSSNQVKEIKYGIKASTNISKLETYLFAPGLRCQTEVNIVAQVKNRGTAEESGILYFKYDPIFKYVSSTKSTASIIGDTLVAWSFEKLQPFENLELYIRLRVPGVTQANIDSIYFFKLWTEVPSRSEIFCYQDKIRCSFDPNDKAVNPYREDNLALLGGELMYTIRFENTGNDYAQDVIIKDVLDKNLDLNTFRVVNSSHSAMLETKREGENVNFVFHNIFLPAKRTDQVKCQGFVSYKIAPLSGLPEQTKIDNTANIYFDFNPPIITNTTTSILVTNFTTNTTDIETNKIFCFPNPTRDALAFSENLDKIELFTVQGQLIKVIERSNTLEMSRFSAGLYLVKVYQGKLQQTFKINKAE